MFRYPVAFPAFRRTAVMAVVVIALAGQASADATDTRLHFKAVPLEQITVSGELRQRLDLTARQLREGMPEAYLLRPFKGRTGLASNGQLLANWIEFIGDYAALTRNADLKKEAQAYARAVVALRRDDGFIGLDPAEMWDGWVANRLVAALLKTAEHGSDAGLREAAVRLAQSLATRFPPEEASLEQAVIGRCVLEALCRAYDRSGDEGLRLAAMRMGERDTSRLLDHLIETKRLGYPAERAPQQGDDSHLVMTYLVGLALMNQMSAAAHLQGPLEDAWVDLDRQHRYVTGGLPGVLRWRGGTLPTDSDDSAATGQWLLFNLVLWQTTGEVRYVEMIERILFNHLPFTQAVDGQFTSSNHLQGRSGHADPAATGAAARAMIEALTAICSARGNEVYVNLYVPSTVALTLGDLGMRVLVTQETEFPTNGTVAITLSPPSKREFDVLLRVPSWCPAHTVSVNGEAATPAVKDGYARLSREWSPGDRIELNLSMEFRVDRRSGAAPKTTQAAVWWGPTLLCVDSQFNGGLRGPFRFEASPGHEAELFATISPATVGRPAGPFPVRAAASGKAFSAGRGVVVYLTPLANCVRGPEAWWRVWLTVYEPQAASPEP